MAAAASGLKSQAAELVALVSIFKVNGSDAAFHGGAASLSHRAPAKMAAPKTTAKSTAKPATKPVAKAPALPAAQAIAAKPQAPKTQPKPAPAGGDDDWETF
jgi:hypothetical protein